MDLHLIQSGVACVDVAMAAVSWLILLCTYPDFARWRAEGFAEAHETYTRRVGWVVGPLLLSQLGGHVWMAFLDGRFFGLGLVRAVPSATSAGRPDVAGSCRAGSIACLADGGVVGLGRSFFRAVGGLTGRGRQ